MRWLLDLRRQRYASREAEAYRLIASAGAAAHAIARRMARDANDFSTMRYWTSVQAIILRKSSGSLSVRHPPQSMIYALIAISVDTAPARRSQGAIGSDWPPLRGLRGLFAIPGSWADSWWRRRGTGASIL